MDCVATHLSETHKTTNLWATAQGKIRRVGHQEAGIHWSEAVLVQYQVETGGIAADGNMSRDVHRVF